MSGEVVLAFDENVVAGRAGSPGEILPPMLGDECARRPDVVRDPVLVGRCDG